MSVIIATYNRKELLRRAIESVLRQTYDNYEIIVVDDGSTDGTSDSLASFGDSLRCISQENKGLAAARNRAIRESRGELIALLDSDDWWTDDKLEKCVAFLQLHPENDVVYTPMATVDSQGRVLSGHDKVSLEGLVLDDVFENTFVHDPAAVFHRRVWEDVGGFDESLPVCVGHNFWLRVAVKHRFGLITEPLAVRVWMKDSLTRGNRVRGQLVKVGMLERFFEEHPGSAALNKSRARRSLARAYYSAGKILLRFDEVDLGVQYLRRSWHYRPGWPRPLPFYLLGLVKKRFSRHLRTTT